MTAPRVIKQKRILGSVPTNKGTHIKQFPVIAATGADGKPLVHWFVDRETLEKLLAATEPDDCAFIETALFRIELSAHSTLDAADKAMRRLHAEMKLTMAVTKGQA